MMSTWSKVKEKNSFVPSHSMLNLFPVFKIYETFLIYSLSLYSIKQLTAALYSPHKTETCLGS